MVIDVVDAGEHSDPVSAARFSAGDAPTTVYGVEIAVFDGEAVLFDVNSSMLHRLGAIAGAVWLCCDGSTAIGAMIDELADMFDLDRSELEPAVYDSIERFADEGLLAGHSAPTRIVAASEPTRANDGTEILNRPPDP
jgi:hypothetical protein